MTLTTLSDFRRVLLVAAVLLLSRTCLGSGNLATAEAPRPPLVSMVKLLANPTEFLGRRVRVTGYFVAHPDMLELYLTEFDAIYHIIENGLCVTVLDGVIIRRSGCDVPLSSDSVSLANRHVVTVSGVVSNVPTHFVCSDGVVITQVDTIEIRDMK